MGCTPIIKHKSPVPVESSSCKRKVTNHYPRMARVIKIFNFKSSLATIIEVKPYLECSLNIELPE